MFRCAPCLTSVRGFSNDDNDDTASYLTMAARGIHECTLDSYFTANVPKEADNMDFSHSFSEIGSDFSFGLKCENAKRESERKELERSKTNLETKNEKLSKTKQKYIVDDQQLTLEGKTNKQNVGKKLKLKWQSV